MSTTGSLTEPYAPVVLRDLDIAFPAHVAHLMPAYGSVKPERQWRDLQARWFFQGLPPETTFHPREGVDPRVALRHLRAIQGSFEPKHEHKEEAVAFLLGHWFESVVTPDKAYGAEAATR